MYKKLMGIIIISFYENAKNENDKPSVIICNTTIGFGSPNKAGGHDCHGAPLGDKMKFY